MKLTKKNLFANPDSDRRQIDLYIKYLRKVEYFSKSKNSFFILLKVYYLFKLRRKSYLTGFQIPPFTCGSGLTIWHWGSIIINSNSIIGDNVTLYPGVVIGHKNPGEKAPVIGNNVFIGSGSKIIGAITIGENVIIAPNSVVVKDVPSNCTIAGIPAKILKEN